MTSYQDQPLTRREIRQREAEAARAAEAAAHGVSGQPVSSWVPDAVQPGQYAPPAQSAHAQSAHAQSAHAQPAHAQPAPQSPHAHYAPAQPAPQAAPHAAPQHQSHPSVPYPSAPVVMSRRELRARREAEAAASAARSTPAPAQPVPPPLVEPSAPAGDHLADLEALFRAQAESAMLSSAVAPHAHRAAPSHAFPSVPQPEPPTVTTPIDSHPPVADPAPIPLTGSAESAPAASVPTGRPRNHWSRQAELDDASQQSTGALVRDVSSATVTANVLVLPEIPTPDVIMSPVRSTGEVLVTGSISLPASLSSTGALPTQLDESDLDALLEMGDAQVVSTDSQPVRAIRAVSTHTSSREIIAAHKPRRTNRALTALIIAAAGMAVVVVTLLVVALTSGVLGGP